MTIRFVTLSLTTVATPVSIGSGVPAQHHLAALAMLILEQTDAGWAVRLRSAAVGAGDGEARLLAWATDQLPDSGIAIGWRLADNIVRLLDAARETDPQVASPFIDRFTRLVTAPSVDLALGFGGAAAPPLVEVAAANGIPLVTMTPAEVETAWAFGDTASLRRDASAQAVAALRLWLAGAPSHAFPAKEAFTAWLADDDPHAGSENAVNRRSSHDLRHALASRLSRPDEGE